MREYGKMVPAFWVGATGRALRGHPEAQVIAAYLVTCPSANMVGLYYLPLPTLCHETGIPLKGALKALLRVEEVGFAAYDHPSEMVWVPEMAKYQIGDSLKPSDNRVKGILREVETYKKSKFFGEFVKKYWDAFSLPGPIPETRGSEAPSKALRSQEQEQEQEQEQAIAAAGEQSAMPEVLPDLDQQVVDHWHREYAPNEKPLKLSKRLRQKIAERRRERPDPATAQQELLDSISGWKNDPWKERQFNIGLGTLLYDADKVRKGLALFKSPPSLNSRDSANADPSLYTLDSVGKA